MLFLQPVMRPTAKTELRFRRGAALTSAGAAEKRKHKTYDAGSACKRDGSKMVPFALESYSAKSKPTQLGATIERV